MHLSFYIGPMSFNYQYCNKKTIIKLVKQLMIDEQKMSKKPNLKEHPEIILLLRFKNDSN